eukprot:NODE_4411_length_1895_cov_2.843891.p1 GENE.NODE_4411_length_1895_cov_2.843891~~NODE_4411_length_1895_cov_2.843891.p1  ORF type:complete len:610 (-),score=253.68 NODE_4411_length_1895_cov_2.843891:65-1783(-)
MANLKSIRNGETTKFAETKARYEADIAAVTEAIKVLSEGLAGGSLLQAEAQKTLRRVLANSKRSLDADVEGVIAFLASGRAGVSPGLDSSEINGMMKQIKDDMVNELAAATEAEHTAQQEYNGLIATKTASVNAVSQSIEKNIERVGVLAVEIVQGHDDLEDARTTLAEDQEFLAHLDKTCGTRHQEFDEQAKMRAEELRALQETIKIMTDDDALELFKKSLPSPASSFVQLAESSANLKRSALQAIRETQKRQHSDGLDFIALAIRGKQVGFGHVVGMINDMIENLHKSQGNDEKKKSWCEDKLGVTNKDKAHFERVISDLESEAEEAKQTLATVKEEIQALQGGVAALDKSVAEATAQRKSEHAEYTDLLAQDAASKQLINFAKNRLNQFYNPKLYKAPEKKELSREGRISESFSFVQVLQRLGRDAPAPAPEAGSYAKNHEGGTGVIAMLDLLIKDLDKETQEAKVEEKNAQADYEEAMQDASARRAASAKSLTMKTASEASLAERLQALDDQHASTSEKLSQKKENLRVLHEECDWLLQNFDERKEARTSEVDALERAKSVLSGADYA